MKREPITPLAEQDARRVIRGWCEDPALWVVVVDGSLIGWLRRLCLEVYNGDMRDGWFQVMTVGPLLVAAAAKSEMSRADLAGRFRELDVELPEDDPNDPEAFLIATAFGDETTQNAGEGFARWITGTGTNRENDAPRPKRIRRRCNPLRQRR